MAEAIYQSQASLLPILELLLDRISITKLVLLIKEVSRRVAELQRAVRQETNHRKPEVQVPRPWLPSKPYRVS